MHILVVAGTRPEIIKLAPVVHALRVRAGVQARICMSGQHGALASEPLRLFGLEPDIALEPAPPGIPLAALVASLTQRLDAAIAAHPVDWVVVQGDTATTLSAALAAYYRGVPVAHVEAGLRTGDLRAPWPEEGHRRMTGAVADLHFAPTAGARRNLLREGIAEPAIAVTGNTGIDALLQMRQRLARDAALRARAHADLPELRPDRRLLVVTAHRRENLGTPMQRICAALRGLAQRGDIDITFAVHPNPNVAQVVPRELDGVPGITICPPLDYAAFVTLIDSAFLLLTDSGGLQEEAPSLGKPVLVLRDVTERIEAIEAGTAILVGTDPERIVSAATRLLDDPQACEKMRGRGNPFGDGAAAARIAARLTGRKCLPAAACEETRSNNPSPGR
ncbi:MAG: non-hydrolyzing UDP-N-acetylglucosamine 2-epimerase [Gammaproteobacteria bacterium]